jgi:hypothetical protein
LTSSSEVPSEEPEEELDVLVCDVTCAVVTVILRVKELIVVMATEDPINPITNPNHVFSHSYT